MKMVMSQEPYGPILLVPSLHKAINPIMGWKLHYLELLTRANIIQIKRTLSDSLMKLIKLSVYHIVWDSCGVCVQVQMAGTEWQCQMKYWRCMYIFPYVRPKYAQPTLVSSCALARLSTAMAKNTFRRVSDQICFKESGWKWSSNIIVKHSGCQSFF